MATTLSKAVAAMGSHKRGGSGAAWATLTATFARGQGVTMAARPTKSMRTLPPNTEPSVTLREEEVLGLMVEGKSNPEIAQALVISRSTVKFHVSSNLSKLGATSRTEAVSRVLQEELIAI